MDQMPPYMSDDEWDEAKMFGQFFAYETGEEFVAFRRIDLASYLSALGIESESSPNAS